ncbi:S8 family serine peptidase [Nonomuraea sediminis]|uniref:S8 family serine peptidase n=1 Tax=Nonomuraea sediminis TaxID=2835864 RepID=UPI001BDBBD55|nr:S8 family serine peptidase [Nonomuraea sediminis]
MLTTFVAAGLCALMVSPAQQLSEDFAEARRTTDGRGTTVAVLSAGVRPGLRNLDRGKDLVKRPREARISGTLAASVLSRLAPGARLLSVRIRPEEEDFPDGAKGLRKWSDNVFGDKIFAAGVRWATDHGANVIWTDYGPDGYDSEAADAVDYAAEHGAVVVAAATVWVAKPGNDPDDYPRSLDLPGAIEVGTANGKGVVALGSRERTDPVLVSAPGAKIHAAGPEGTSWTMWGGSAASLHVGAAAALVKSKFPSLRPALVASALGASARGAGHRYDPAGGFGLVNPAGALEEAGRLTAMKPAAEPVRWRPPEAITVVRPDPLKVAGYSAAILLGLAALGLAWLRRRRL